MKIVPLFIFVLLVASCHRPLIKELEQKQFLSNNTKQPTLVMVSATGCGYSKWAKQTINSFIGNPNVKLVFLEFEENHIDTLINGYSIGTNNLEHFNYKFFPQFFLIDYGDKPRRVKGWGKKQKEIVEKFLNKKTNKY